MKKFWIVILVIVAIIIIASGMKMFWVSKGAVIGYTVRTD